MIARFRGTRLWPRLVLAGLLLSLPMAFGGCYALINDITTDLVNPPVFMKSPPAERTYDAAKYRALQEANYPDIKNMAGSWPVDDAFARVLAIVRRREWPIEAIDGTGHRVQAVAVTRVLRFRDDVIIEVRPPEPGAPAGTQSTIVMRSKSRLGRSDFGANAKRIRQFFADVRAEP